MKTPESCLGPVRANQLGVDYWFKGDRSQGLVAGKGVDGEVFSVPPQEQVLGCEQPLLEKERHRP